MANSRSYSSNPNSSFFSLEDDDVDDAEFLKNSRTESNQGSGWSTPSYRSQVNDLEIKKQQLIDRRAEIENKSLASTERSLGLLRESEQVGIATAEELQHQREQLERTEKNLDNINSTLRFTQKNIDGIKSVFGSIKNYLRKKPEQPGGSSSEPPITPVDRTSYLNEIKNTQTPDAPHPGLVLRGLEEQPRSSASTNERIEQNLDLMAQSVMNLKGLATGLGEEIISQSELVDKILYKSEKADLTINTQNKEMNRILKK